MSDYYYLDDKESDLGYTPVLGDDFVSALLSIAKRHGVKITDRMILAEIFKKKLKKGPKRKGSPNEFKMWNGQNGNQHFEANYIPFELKFRLPKLRKWRIIAERRGLRGIVSSKVPTSKLSR